MKTISMIFAFAATAGFGALAYTGCSSSDAAPAGPGPTTVQCDITDPLNPPIEASPELCDAPKCTNTTKVDKCPANGCMSVVEQTGDVKNFRMGRIRLWQPQALLSLTSIAVDPNVNPACFNNGTETFTWLIQYDSKKNTITTGGSRASKDGGRTFAFLTGEKANAADLEGVCPGFKGPAEPIDLSPVVSTVMGDGTTGFTTPKIPKINVPIFDATTGVPIILPLSQAYLQNVKIKGSCIGSWDKTYFCDGDSLGWTTGGAVIAKITAEEADRVPVKSAGCQSLCAILVNDASKTDKGTCKKGPDGKIPAIGNACVNGTGECNDAFLLSATFGAYGVDIGTASPPTDSGVTDTGSDDTGAASDSGSASDGASGG